MISYLFRMLPKLLQPISQVNDELWLSLKHTGPQYSPLWKLQGEGDICTTCMYNNPFLKNNKIMFVRWYI